MKAYDVQVMESAAKDLERVARETGRARVHALASEARACLAEIAAAYAEQVQAECPRTVVPVAVVVHRG